MTAAIVTVLAAAPAALIDLGRVDFGRVDFGRVDFGRVDFGRVEPGAVGWGLVLWWSDPFTVVLALTAVVLVAAVGVVILVARGRAAARDRVAGLWWEITPPGRPAPGSAVALWQLLGGLLRRHPGRWWWPTRLAVEVVATAETVRIGLWLPPALRTVAPERVLAAVMPGARITPAPGPTWPATGMARGVSGGGSAGVSGGESWGGSVGVSVVELVPRGGVWAPVLDPTVSALLTHTIRSPDSDGEREPLRLLYALLTGPHPGEQAAVQLVVGAQHGTRPRPGAGIGSGGAGVWGGLARLGLLLGRGVALLAALAGREVLDLLTTPTGVAGRGRAGSVPRAGGGIRGGGDPVAAAARAARDAKRAAGPHLRVTLRLALATRTDGPGAVAARRGRLRELVGGYDLVTTPLRAHRRRHPARLLVTRALGAWFVATTAELAGLWHLPAEPGRYRLPVAPARDRGPVPALLDPPTPRHRPPRARPTPADTPPPTRTGAPTAIPARTPARTGQIPTHTSTHQER